MRDNCRGDRKPLHLELSQSCLGVSHVFAASNSLSRVLFTMLLMDSSSPFEVVPSFCKYEPYTERVSGCFKIFS
jgi:hypothetical protein